jgi:hypothetical protein
MIIIIIIIIINNVNNINKERLTFQPCLIFK